MPVEAVLTCWSNSHPFLERRIILSASVKIGRSVAQARPANNNAIFDCKVLSRNHALLWHEDGKFFLQDTKSSNGTFVNNQRLSKSGEESAPRQLSSSDILQFGVDVVENSRKVTHSCIMTTIKLFDEEGNEVKNATLDNSGSINNTTQSQEFFQLVHCLQEALHREHLLEEKLTSLQQIVLSTNESAVQGWKNQIDEDKLLARLDILENQLCVFNKLQPEDGLRKEVLTLQKDKINYEIEAKNSIRTVIEEKLEISQKLADLEIQHSSVQEQVKHLESVQTSMQTEFEDILEKNKVLNEEHTKLKEEFETLQKHSEEEKTALNNEKTELNNKYEQLTTQNNILINKVENLQADNDFSTQQLNNIKDQMKSMKADETVSTNAEKGVQAELINLLDIKSLMSMQGEDRDEEGSNEEDVIAGNDDEGGHVLTGKDGVDGSDDDEDEDDEDEKNDEKTDFEICEKVIVVKTKDKCKDDKNHNETMSKKQQGKQAEDLMKLQVECKKLKQTVVNLKGITEGSQNENTTLKIKYTALKELYNSIGGRDSALEKLNKDYKIVGDSVVGLVKEGGEGEGVVLGAELNLGVDSNITDSQKELQEKLDEVRTLEQYCDESKEERLQDCRFLMLKVENLQGQLGNAVEDLQTLSQNSTTISIASLIPILVLLISLVMAFYPFFAFTTATSTVTI